MGIYSVFLAELFDLNLMEDILYLGICKKRIKVQCNKKETAKRNDCEAGNPGLD